MTKSIPSDQFSSVTPGVVSPGGSALDLLGLVLSPSTRVPTGLVYPFPDADAVGAFFGLSSDEYAFATNYMLGYDNSFKKPGSILFAQYNTAAVAAYLRGGNVSALTLTQLKALTGTLTLDVNGTPITSGAIVLTAATSFSNAAAIIQAAFTTPTFTVSYDSVSGAFVFTSNTTGAASTMAFATGTSTIAHGLLLLAADGGSLSQGADAAVPATFMTNVIGQTTNWATFGLTFDPDGGSGNTIKLEFAAWTVTRNNRYAYIAWDTDLAPTTNANATESMGNFLDSEEASGICPIYSQSYKVAAMVMGSVASLDFGRKNGRATMAYRSQEGLAGEVNDATVAQNLQANGYNFYGIVADATETDLFFFPGSVTGEYSWLDSYVCQIKLNAELARAGLTLMRTVPSIPFNSDGEGLIRAAYSGPIQDALNFGTIRTGIELDSLEIAAVNNAAGVAIDTILTTKGYYLQVLMPSAQVRKQRGSWINTLWYTDGQSVQKLQLASINVQ